MGASSALLEPLNPDEVLCRAVQGSPHSRSSAWRSMSSADPLQSFDRLLDRDGTFRQSKGRFNIVRRLPRRISCSFYLEDWFHSLVNTRIHRIFLVLVLFYLTAYFGFALAFSLVDDVCLPDYYSDHPGNGVKRFVRSLYFSLETMMAIGHRASCRRSAMSTPRPRCS